jgi:acyl transferase domain-containing protein/acyl carrier protein
MELDLPQIAVLPRVVGQTVGHIQPMEPSGAQEASKSKPAIVGLLQRLQHDAPEDRQSKLQRHILELAASILGCAATALDPQRGFFDQGLDSLNVVELRNRLQRDLAQPLPITLPFNFPTVTTLADELLQQFGAATPNPVSARPTPLPARTGDIAIIGMGCRLPGGVCSPEAFWGLLRDGIDAISEVPPDRWNVDSYYHPDPDHPGTIVTRYGGFVDGVEQFDAVFFGISPREARQLDPQQRLLLEVCWETLEHAGVPPSSLLGTQTGVFIGISTNDYLQRLNRRVEEIDAYLGTGNALSLAANRLSYTFGLEGPSLAIDTACSSSLVAIHQACQSLRSGESDIAIGGGVNLLLDPTVSINHSRAHMLAPDGRCKAFSAAADGMVRAEGCGLVLLKRLSDALRDGDSILAIIRGSAVNQDGRTSGLTVPNGPAQQRVIRRALQQAALEPAAVSYVEAHGTGTPLGDPIEADALTAVFAGTRKCLTVGSVKTNIGHLESAAGVAGMMKIVLALQHRMIPAHLHCETLNPHLDWTGSPLRIPSTTEHWPAESGPRRAGVSSFGFGGTNAHVILEEAPPPKSRKMPAWSRYLLPLSAKTETALRDLARRYVVYLETTTDYPADICYTAACGRDHFVQRLAVLGDTLAALQARLNAWLGGKPDGDVWSGSAASAETTSQVQNHTPQAASADPSNWADLAASYVRGVGPDWAACYHGLKLRRVLLPGHPFERQTYSVDPPTAAVSRPQCYRLHWTVEPELPLLPPHLSDHWLILADGKGWGEALAAELEGHGGRCTLVYRAPTESGHRSLAADDNKALHALLDEAGTLRGVVHLWSLDSPSPSVLDANNLLDAQRHSLGSVLHLAQALNDLPQPPRLWLLSRAAQAVVPGDRLEGLAQSTLWGLGRSLALEFSRLWGGLLDLPVESPTPQYAAAVCAALYGPAEDSQRALRAGRFHVPRLRLWAPERRRTVTVRADASYLITGGFGSLGRQLGRWLVQHGARNLWLLGRRGATDAEARAYLEELYRLGVTTQVGAVDVADATALTAQLAEWQRIGPPLRGVVHAAGLNAQTPLATLDWPAFATVLAPKLQGTWTLQHNTAALDLDFFAVCSSIAGLWGAKEQASYCAANAFLDGFAAYRQAQGQAALSINWGPLSDSAMVNEAAAAELRSYGIYPTPLARSTAELLPLLSDGAAQVAYVAADWARFVPLYQSRCATGFFSTLPISSLAPTIGRPEVAVKAAVQTDWPTALRTWLTEQLSSTLGLTPQQLDADVPLPSLGLDSLMAVELRNRLQRQLGREVPLPDLLGDMSLNDLVAILVGTQIAPVVKPLEPAGKSKWVIGEI